MQCQLPAETPGMHMLQRAAAECQQLLFLADAVDLAASLQWRAICSKHLAAGNRISSSARAWNLHTARRKRWRSAREDSWAASTAAPALCRALASAEKPWSAPLIAPWKCTMPCTWNGG